MSRIAAREKAFLLIFEYIFKGEKSDLTYQNLTLDHNLSEDDLGYIKTVYDGVCQRYQDFLDIISKYAEGYRADRIYKIDLGILLLALFELKFMDDIPVSVSCNEAVNLAHAYSTEKSPSYINGILAAIISNEGISKK